MSNAGDTGRDYEILVQAFYEQALDEEGTEVYHRRKYTGTSGQVYEIDLSFSFTRAGLKYLTVIECKFHSRPVEVGHALEFSRKLQDIGAHKGILVSKSGFQEGVLKIGISDGIALVQINPPIEDIIMSNRGDRIYLDNAVAGFQELDESGDTVPLVVVMFTKKVGEGLAIPRASLSQIVRAILQGLTGGRIFHDS